MSAFIKQLIASRSSTVVATAAIATSASYLFVGREDDSGLAGSPRIVRTALCHSGNAAAPVENHPPPMSLPSLQKVYLEFHAPKELLENLAVEMIAEMEKILKKNAAAQH